MSDTTYLSPVPDPSTDAETPGVYREIYGMPMFARVTTLDLAESARFWVGGLGFEELFSVPERLIHLRRWAFQDVLLVPGESAATGGVLLSFACVMQELDTYAAACEAMVEGSVTGPVDTPWNSRELTVVTPEGARIVMTAAKPMPKFSPMPV